MNSQKTHPILVGFDSVTLSSEKLSIQEMPRSRRRTSLLSNMLQTQTSGLSSTSDDQSESSESYTHDLIGEYHGPESSSSLFNDEEFSSKIYGPPSSLPSSPIPIPNVTYLKNPQHIEERNRLLKAMIIHRTRAELEKNRL
ncbi:hypothetical protein CEUSTIGMA_g257.t1 [Chlamydomonas eustigma]|uniref:Uncharacterized protein n=1 Tax=Chlamydomonas eustigma TaxID=1157962 RepID=A0A250WQ64_9CHLO|nr:hypothetical protein CEUSTIGMA_g257.t1 [Chlamydomonas eustigma]|eukprot:GAX72802.1 hypothetical protein CEUSTIGMA_g257.t1 [Chlamydomonas eustigma]